MTYKKFSLSFKCKQRERGCLKKKNVTSCSPTFWLLQSKVFIQEREYLTRCHSSKTPLEEQWKSDSRHLTLVAVVLLRVQLIGIRVARCELLNIMYSCMKLQWKVEDMILGKVPSLIPNWISVCQVFWEVGLLWPPNNYRCFDECSKSATSLNVYQPTWCNIPEDLNLHQHCCEKFKSHNWRVIFVIFLELSKQVLALYH